MEMYKSYDGVVRTRDQWLWRIGFGPKVNGTPEEIFARCVRKGLLVRVNKKAV